MNETDMSWSLIRRICPIIRFEELSQLVTDVDGVVLGLDEWNEAVFKIAPRLKVLAKFASGWTI